MIDLVRASKALSDETRVRTLSLLLAKECCVCEVMHCLKISQTRASRSLKILFDAGFLKMREEGSFTLYSIKKNNSNHVRSLLVQALEEDFGRSVAARKERERLSTAKRFDCKAVIKAKYKTLPDELPQHDCCATH